MDTMTAHWSDVLVPLRIVREFVKWARTQPSLHAAWSTCERGDWMLSLASRYSGEQGSPTNRILVLASCRCARLVLPLVDPGEERPEAAIALTEQWAAEVGDITLDDVKEAAEAVDDAWNVAGQRAHIYTTYSAIYNAADPDSAGNVIAYVAHAAALAAHAAALAAPAPVYNTPATQFLSVKSRVLRECADIIRGFYPEPPTLVGVKS